jgi:hypothetical protein
MVVEFTSIDAEERDVWAVGCVGHVAVFLMRASADG